MVKFNLLLSAICCLSLVASGQKFSAYVNAGEKAMQQGDYYSALLYFEKAQEFETGDTKLNYRMAEASRLFNDYYPAAYWYNQVVLKDADGMYPLALYWLAMMNKMQGEYESAKNLFYRYYTKHQADSDYYSIRAGLEYPACEAAYQMMKDTLPVRIRNLEGKINTVYSDFAAQEIADSLLYYSSLRFQLENPATGKPERFVTRMLKSPIKNKKYDNPLPLDTVFNTDTMHNANSAFSSDYRVMVFARCVPLSYSDMQCALFICFNEKGKWSAPTKLNDAINLAGYTSTQPCVAARGAEGYRLYFVSDRPGGYGKLDVYQVDFTPTGDFGDPVNAGPMVNSDENDITPFFHNSSQTLYFSSDRHTGLGGYDVFKSAFSENTLGEPVNEGYPVNTSYHDLYFTKSEKDDRGLLSSNRPGSLFIKSRTCCYDIYSWQQDKPAIVKTDTALKEKVTPVAVARQLLPMVLYFHNDEPDPRTMKVQTKTDYKQLYDAYMAMQPEYEARYAQGLEGDRKAAALASIDKLFSQKIKAGYDRLNRFAGLLLEELKDRKKVKITVRGQASPLAKPDYNVNLSKRRISSFLNYLMWFNNGALKRYVDGGQLFIEEVGAGESLAREFVSDDLSDQRNSVYSPAAALERKIEVIDVQSEAVE